MKEKIKIPQKALDNFRETWMACITFGLYGGYIIGVAFNDKLTSAFILTAIWFISLFCGLFVIDHFHKIE
jgi:hypothetical protein